jgi:predicted nuclease with TOPRIM domain
MLNHSTVTVQQRNLQVTIYTATACMLLTFMPLCQLSNDLQRMKQERYDALEATKCAQGHLSELQEELKKVLVENERLKGGAMMNLGKLETAEKCLKSLQQVRFLCD